MGVSSPAGEGCGRSVGVPQTIRGVEHRTLGQVLGVDGHDDTPSVARVYEDQVATRLVVLDESRLFQEADKLPRGQRRRLILIRFQVETNNPGPRRETLESLWVTGQAGQPLMELRNNGLEVGKYSIGELFL